MDVKGNVLELSRVGFETEISLLLWMSRVLEGCCWRVVVQGGLDRFVEWVVNGMFWWLSANVLDVILRSRRQCLLELLCGM
jgi:hypothetical protein